MSTEANTIWYESWYERAAECIHYFEGKLPAELIQKALDEDNMEDLQKFVMEAEAEWSRQEFYGHDALLGQNDNY